jgi:hypothetical protein
MRLTQRQSSAESITWFFGVVDVRTPLKSTQLDIVFISLIWIAPTLLLGAVVLLMNSGAVSSDHAPRTCGVPSTVVQQRVGGPLSQ